MPTAGSLGVTYGDEALLDGPWIAYLDLPFLQKNYPSWAAAVSTVPDAACAFRRRGFFEFATLAEGMHFDPAYYSEANPGLSGASDLELYRTWLMDGLPAGRPGSPDAHLRKLDLSVGCYPPGFPWEFYAQLRPHAGGHRWAALEDFCASGFAVIGDRINFGPSSSELLIDLGRKYSYNNDRLAIQAYELARSCSPMAASDRQHLADAYLRQALWRPALDLYREIIRDGMETVWTVQNLVKCAFHVGQLTYLVDDFKTIRPRLIGRSLWSDDICGLTDAIFEVSARNARTLMSAGNYADADHVLLRGILDLAELLTTVGPLVGDGNNHEKNTILLLSNPYDGGTNKYIAEISLILREYGLKHEVISVDDKEKLTVGLAKAIAVILFRVPALPSVLRCIISARQLGAQLYYHSGAALLDTDSAPDIASFRGLLTREMYNDLRFGLPLFRAAAQLCDFALAPTRGLADSLGPLVLSGRWFVIRDAPPEKMEVARTQLEQEPSRSRLFLRAVTLTFLDADSGTIGENLLEVLRRRVDVDLYVSGPLHLDRRFDLLGDRIQFIASGQAQNDFRSYLAKSDINLILRCSTLDDEHEAEISWSEAAVHAVPSVMFMPAGLISHLRHEENLLRAAGASCWAAALDRLLEDPGLRERLASRAMRDTVRFYAFAQEARDTWMSNFKSPSS
jgi:hypothetical protein